MLSACTLRAWWSSNAQHTAAGKESREKWQGPAMPTQRTPRDSEQQQMVETISKRGSRGPDGLVIEHVTQRYPGPDGRTQHVGSHRRDRLDKEV